MSKDKQGNDNQTKSSKKVDEIVQRLSAPRKINEPTEPDRRSKIEREMTAADIDEMVSRLSSVKRQERQKSAYEQGGVLLTYSCTGWTAPGSGGKHY